MALADTAVWVAVLGVIGRVAMAVTAAPHIALPPPAPPGDVIARRAAPQGRPPARGRRRAPVRRRATPEPVAHAVVTYAIPAGSIGVAGPSQPAGTLVGMDRRAGPRRTPAERLPTRHRGGRPRAPRRPRARSDRCPPAPRGPRGASSTPPSPPARPARSAPATGPGPRRPTRTGCASSGTSTGSSTPGRGGAWPASARSSSPPKTTTSAPASPTRSRSPRSPPGSPGRSDLCLPLTEAIALAHDCGHGPAGHASEEAFSPYLPGGYDHAVYGADVTLAPLNLCRETLDGVRNHSWRRPAADDPRGRGRRLGRPHRVRLPRLRRRGPGRDPGPRPSCPPRCRASSGTPPVAPDRRRSSSPCSTRSTAPGTSA